MQELKGIRVTSFLTFSPVFASRIITEYQFFSVLIRCTSLVAD